MNNLRHPEFILNYILFLKPNSYLELGLYKGETFNQVCDTVKICVGVDNKNHGIVKGTIYEMSTTKFFSINKQTFDMIFIDANHQYESVKADFICSIDILNHGGTIILHDTDPTDKKYLDPGYCGDAYRIIDYIHKHYPYLDMLTLPISHEGLTIVRKRNDRRISS